jgi:kinesin light chain
MALENYHRSLEILENKLGKNHPNAGKVLASIGKVYYQQKDYTNALEYYQRAYEIRAEKYGEEHADTIKTKTMIDEINAILKEQEDK